MEILAYSEVDSASLPVRNRALLWWAPDIYECIWGVYSLGYSDTRALSLIVLDANVGLLLMNLLCLRCELFDRCVASCRSRAWFLLCLWWAQRCCAGSGESPLQCLCAQVLCYTRVSLCVGVINSWHWHTVSPLDFCRCSVETQLSKGHWAEHWADFKVT